MVNYFYVNAKLHFWLFYVWFLLSKKWGSQEKKSWHYVFKKTSIQTISEFAILFVSLLHLPKSTGQEKTSLFFEESQKKIPLIEDHLYSNRAHTGDISSVVEFQRWWVLKSIFFGQESTILKVKKVKNDFWFQFWFLPFCERFYTALLLDTPSFCAVCTFIIYNG